jgi:IrrE N-terminal-like domain
MTKFVPYLTEEAIERDAVALLAEYAQARGVIIAPPIPIEDIVEKHLKLGIEFDDTHRRFGVPRESGQDPDILGAIFFDTKRIVIDESLDPEVTPAKEGRYRFTLAHEGGGHWRLHRHLFVKDPAQAGLFGWPGSPSVVCRSSQAKEPVEWQADFYASCLLMPRKFVLEAWHRRFGTTNPIIFELHKNDPAAILHRSNWVHISEARAPAFGGGDELDCKVFFNRISREFAHVFKVSTEAMRIRLEKLGLLLREVPHQQTLAGVDKLFF